MKKPSINDVLVLAHNFVALGFELRKREGLSYDVNSPMAGIHSDYLEIDKLMKEIGAEIHTIQTKESSGIVYKLVYDGEERLLDPDRIHAAIQLLG